MYAFEYLFKIMGIADPVIVRIDSESARHATQVIQIDNDDSFVRKLDL